MCERGIHYHKVEDVPFLQNRVNISLGSEFFSLFYASMPEYNFSAEGKKHENVVFVIVISLDFCPSLMKLLPSIFRS